MDGCLLDFSWSCSQARSGCGLGMELVLPMHYIRAGTLPNTPNTHSVMVESALLSTPLCELRPVHVYSPSWLALTPVIFNTEVTLPVVNSNSPKSGRIGG